MKVKDLLILLSEMPENADVVAKGYEGGVDDIVNVQLVKLNRDVHDEWYYGRHEIKEDGDVQAVFIQREERETEEVRDYTKDPHKWLDDQDMDFVVKQIQEKRKSYKKSK